LIDPIENALNELYQRQITTREQLLTEILRVKLTQRALKGEQISKKDKEGLFLHMKKVTEEPLGFFPADREDFHVLYQVLDPIDLITFTLLIYKEDRSGMIVSPRDLTKQITEKIKTVNPKTILITEAEKHLDGLKELIQSFRQTSITLTTQHRIMFMLLKTIFQNEKHVSVVFESIYSQCLHDLRFDYIYALPAFGKKITLSQDDFISNESEGIAVENLLQHLNKKGMLDIIVPSSLTFTSRREKLRAYIQEYYTVKEIYILPERTFSPSIAVKTYLLSITDSDIETVKIGTFGTGKRGFNPEELKRIPKEEFEQHTDWRIELLLSEDDATIQKFNQSPLKKIKLKETADVFRGKSILKKDMAPGPIAVLNLSNIYNGTIDYTELATIKEDERKVKRYELETGDVVLSCRGTAMKTAVFEKQDKIIIASANLIVIRPKDPFIGGYIKLFLESPFGLAIIKSFQRGTKIMNINHSDIGEIEIPYLPVEKQYEMVSLYNQEQQHYQQKIQEAENQLQSVKQQLYSQLLREKDG
jgi:hypothetical protein